MNMKNGFWLVLLGVLLPGCWSEQIYDELTTFHVSKKLTIEQSVTIKNNCFFTSLIVDDFVVFIAGCDSIFFHVYDKHTLEFLFKFGTQGRGPSEFFTPYPFLSNKTILPEDGFFNFYEINLRQVKRINFQQLHAGIAEDRAILSEYMDIEMYATFFWNQLDDYRIAAIDLSDPEGLFFIYDTRTRKKKWIQYVRSFDMENRFKQSVFGGIVISNGQVIVFASRYFDEIFIFDNQGKLLKHYLFSPIQMPELSTAFTGVVHEAPIFFHSIYGNVNACYLFRSGLSWQRRGQVAHPEIQLFELGWDGDLLNVYGLDFDPAAVSICESTHYLYGVLYNEIQNDSITMVKIALK